MTTIFRKTPGSIAEIFAVSLPLILSNLTIALMSFVDRVFLGWVSPKALAASLPAGALSFAIIALFLGTASYVSTFVAQYLGAGKQERIGPMLWQGVYFSLFTLPIIPLCYFLSPYLLGPFQSDPEILRLEMVYFDRLMVGIVPLTLTFALSSFYSGQGRTWPVFWVNVCASLVNFGLDYVLIFGKFGFPEWGMAGAAWATVSAQWTGVFLYALLLLREGFSEFHLQNFSYHSQEFAKLIRYGLPSGIHFFIDVLAFTFFMLFLGSLGEGELAATNMAFQVHFLAFLPLTGIGLGVSILVGQYMGNKQSKLALKTLHSALSFVSVGLGLIGLTFWFLPEIYLNFFALGATDPALFKVLEVAKILLKFCACFALLDGVQLLYSSLLKGAGDTRFVMFTFVFLGIVLLVLPSWWLSQQEQPNLFHFWWVFAIYIAVLALVFGSRVYLGKWRKINMIEDN